MRKVSLRVAEGDVILPRLGSGQDVGYIDVDGATRAEVARALTDARAALQFGLVGPSTP